MISGGGSPSSATTSRSNQKRSADGKVSSDDAYAGADSPRTAHRKMTTHGRPKLTARRRKKGKQPKGQADESDEAQASHSHNHSHDDQDGAHHCALQRC